jgi:DNA-binding NarL/FixJ family response regulator
MIELGEGWRVTGTTSAVLLDEDEDWFDETEKLLSDLAVEVIAKETNPRAALSRVQQREPDLLLVNFEKRPTEASRPLLECLRLACKRVPTLKAIAFGDARRVAPEDAFAAGAIAYLDRQAAPEDVAAAVRQAFGRSLHFAWSPRE